jgi:anti-sigma regulatory factor (Ser/Thr protein kinase)
MDAENGQAAPDYSTITVALPAGAEASAIARQFVADNRDHLSLDMVEDAQLLVSEIVSNAVRYGRPQITLAMRISPPGVGIVVTDEGVALPTLPGHPPDASQPSGRGLLILDAIASSWGITPHESHPGKAVWFELAPGE